MTDITELTQREKFEAWAEECNALPWGYLKKRRTYDGFYSEHTYTSLWAAWKAASAELVEALEKAQRANAAQDDHINQQQDRIEQLEKGHQEAAKQITSWFRMAKQNIAEREKDIVELDAARQRIAELESRTVTVNLPDDEDGPLAHAYKELTPTFMRNHIAVFERYGIAPNDSSTVIQALRIALDGIERRAAMPQAEPVTTANKLGNSPVIPEGYVMVPKVPTSEMISSGIAAHYDRSKIQIHDRPAPGPMECAYEAMLEAAPRGDN